MLKKIIFDLMNNQPLGNIEPLNLPIVFTLAKGRSGTTLLQTILDGHPNTIAPPESRFVVHFWNRYRNVKRWTPAVKKRFIQDVLSDMKIALFWEINVEILTKRIELLPENTSYGMACKQVYTSRRSLFSKEVPGVIIDKNPIHALLIPIITSIFPDAKFIHVVRDFRANSSSFLKFRPNKSMRELGFMWILFNSKIEELKNEVDNRFHSMEYEELVKNPEKTLRALTTFFELPYHPSMLEYHKTIQNSYTEYVARSPSEEIRKMRELGAGTVHKNLTKPLNPNLIDSWKSTLTLEQVQALEEVCGTYATQYGYDSEIKKEIPKTIPFNIQLRAKKLVWYYSLPIRLRELKSKPNLALLSKP